MPKPFSPTLRYPGRPVSLRRSAISLYLRLFTAPPFSLPRFSLFPGLSASCLIADAVSKTTSARPLSPSQLPSSGSFLGCSARLPHRPPHSPLFPLPYRSRPVFSTCPRLLDPTSLTNPFSSLSSGPPHSPPKNYPLSGNSKPPVNRWFAHTLKGETTSQPVNGYLF